MLLTIFLFAKQVTWNISCNSFSGFNCFIAIGVEVQAIIAFDKRLAKEMVSCLW